jgi:hypothetical protein
MDSGIFLRTRTRLWCWLLGPLVLMAAAEVPSRLYYTQTARSLEYRQAVLALIPQMEERLRIARATAKCFTALPGTDAEVAEALPQILNEAAKRSGFAVRSLNVENVAQSGVATRTVRISAQGDGPIAAVIGLFAELQQSKVLSKIETVRIGTAKLPPDALYSADLAVCFYAVPRGNGNGGR